MRALDKALLAWPQRAEPIPSDDIAAVLLPESEGFDRHRDWPALGEALGAAGIANASDELLLTFVGGGSDGSGNVFHRVWRIAPNDVEPKLKPWLLSSGYFDFTPQRTESRALGNSNREERARARIACAEHLLATESRLNVVVAASGRILVARMSKRELYDLFVELMGDGVGLSWHSFESYANPKSAVVANLFNCVAIRFDRVE